MLEDAVAKYDPLREFLQRQSKSRVPMTFREIERIIGAKLPPTAWRERPWWSNSPTNSVMTKAWLAAGFKSEQVDMTEGKLVFRRVDGAQPDDRGAAPAEGPVPARHPLIGWMKGTLTIPEGVDLTQPVDPEWGEVAYGDRTWDERK
jgi:hypothetical protein